MKDDPYLAVVRARIRSARAAKGLRQEDAANLAGIELRNWQRLENPNPIRKFNPTLETLRAIARALGTTVGDITKEPTAKELAALDDPQQPKRVFKKPRAKSKGRTK